METAILVFCGAALVLSACGFVFTVYFAVMTVANRKPGIDLWEGMSWRPLNHIFHPENLTDSGLAYRRWLALAAVLYILPFIVAWAVAYFAIRSPNS